MNVAFYLGHNSGDPVDVRHPETGNPGIGGTQYVMLLLAHYLMRDSRYDVSVLASRTYILGGGKFIYADDSSLVEICENIRTDILIIRDAGAVIRRDIAKSKLKVVYWSHNYVYADFCRFVCKTPQVKCNVFVGKQQYDRYIDHDVIKKSLTIFNLFNDNCRQERVNDSRSVVFVGAIVKGKGFYEMCRIWKGIVKEVPNAQLHIIGSGQLYGTSELGKYGIASETYEREFMPLITDECGKVLPSVNFHGIVGTEKTIRFLSSSVGIVNPSRTSETFGMVIIEMAAAKLPVVTIEKNGYFDTIVNGKTGILGSSLMDVQRNIIRLLKDPELNERLGAEAKSFIRKFSPEVIVPQWKELLEAVYADNLKIEYDRPIPPFTSDFKWIRRILRFIRFDLKLKFVPSLTDLEYCVLRIRNRLRK